MSTSVLEELAVERLAVEALGFAADLAAGAPVERAAAMGAPSLVRGQEDEALASPASFVGESVDERMAEIDAWLGEAPSEAPSNEPEAARPRAAPMALGVHPAVAAIPGGAAFAELGVEGALVTERGAAPMGAPEVVRGVAVGVREMYRQVRAFLAHLRDAVLGFDRVLLDQGGVRASCAAQLDSDVTLTLVGDPLPPSLEGQVGAALHALLGSLTDALALFSKVMELLIRVVKAATNPVSAVRALWKALRELYELLTRELSRGDRASARPASDC